MFLCDQAGAASEGPTTYRIQQHIPKEDIITINDSCEKLNEFTRRPKPRSQKYMHVLPKRGLDEDASAATASNPLPGSSESGAIPTTARVAEMGLTDDLGYGNHSSVSRATIKFPSLASPVSVVVKIATIGSDEFKTLEHEARICDAFCQHLSEDWSGYRHVEKALYNGYGIVPVKALVPKFYGYYTPIMDELSEPDRDPDWAPKPCIILEDCGKPSDTWALTVEQRTECYSMVFRLHVAGYVQNSLCPRNMLVQPGPLTELPHKRSEDTPSFRIIDLGRCRRWEDFRLKFSEELAVKQWEKMVEDETWRARHTVYG